MIDKFRKKIFWIIEIALIAIVTTIVVVLSIFYYTNAVKNISKKINEYDILDPKHEQMHDTDGREKPKLDTDEVYKLIVKNNEIIENKNNASEELQKLAIKTVSKSNDSGMISDYMYKARKEPDGEYSVTLVENKEMANNIKKVNFILGFLLLAFTIVIYFVSRKISYIVVKPLEKFFEKQKQFISDASHELKTPISIIKINAQMEEKKVGSNKWNKYIQEEAENMDKLVNDLLLLSKVENYENIQKYDTFNISKEMEIIISSFETIAYDKKVILKTKIQENIDFVGSREDIKHILSTLIDNAIKHTKIRDEVTVELNKGKNEIILQVKNMGESIPKEERERIFERFYRVDKSRNRKENRYGLGLAIAKQIVINHNGKISASSENGKTIFKIIFKK